MAKNKLAAGGLTTKHWFGYMFSNFIKTGNPNASGKHPTWLPSTKRQKQALILGEAPTHMAKPSSWKLLKTTLSNKPVGE